MTNAPHHMQPLVDAFLDQECEFGVYSIRKQELLDAFHRWAGSRLLRRLDPSEFSHMVFHGSGRLVGTCRHRIEGRQVPHFTGVRLIKV